MPEPTERKLNQSELRELYAQRRAQFAAAAADHHRRSRLVGNLRGAVFLTALLAFAIAGLAKGAGSFAYLGLVALAGFVVLVTVHARIIEAEDAALRWVRVNYYGELRVTGQFRKLPSDGSRFATAEHLYSDDLDLFGPGSLFQRVSVAHTRYGEDALANALRAPAPVDLIKRRHEAAKQLVPELELRQKLEALALALAEPPPSDAGDQAEGAPSIEARKRYAAPDPGPLFEWAEAEPVLSKKLWLVWLARIMPLITVGAALGTWLLDWPHAAWGVPLMIQLVLNGVARNETARVFTAVSQTEGAFLRYGPMLELLENLEMDAALIRDLRQRLLSGDQKPSVSMKRFRNGVAWFELRHNGLVHPFANLFLMWDVHCVLRLEAWQRTSGAVIRHWFQALGELEALSSFAGFAHDEPAAIWPELVSETQFVAKDLGHPLLHGPQRVCNDVTLPSPGRGLLITGSNMSGKSTMLRSMGLCAVLALAGAPVCASACRLSPLAIRSSLRVRDSLASGVSHFYAELHKIKAVLGATAGPLPVFFLLDEILHGTNSRERQIGARWVFAELLKAGAIGAISTHDMELCQLTGALADGVQLVHFRESVSGDKMTFDYTLRPGPVTAGNALRLMHQIGLPVPLDDGA